MTSNHTMQKLQKDKQYSMSRMSVCGGGALMLMYVVTYVLKSGELICIYNFVFLLVLLGCLEF